MSAGDFPGEPGYCAGCRDFHFVAQLDDDPAPLCTWCRETRRLDPPEPGPYHICNTSDRLKPGHPEYRQCTCGQWYHSGGGYWYRVNHPPARWLREHGLDPEDFWNLKDDNTGPRLFEEFHTRRPTLLMLLRWLFRS